MSIYDASAATALRLITKYGAPVKLTRPGTTDEYTSEYDDIEKRLKWTLKVEPFTVTYDAPTGSDQEFSGFGIKTEFKERDKDGTRIKDGDCLLIIDGSFPAPNDGDKFEIGGNTYNYVNGSSVEPDGVTVIVRRVQVRK